MQSPSDAEALWFYKISAANITVYSEITEQVKSIYLNHWDNKSKTQPVCLEAETRPGQADSVTVKWEDDTKRHSCLNRSA